MRNNRLTFLLVPVVLALGVWALATMRLQTELLPLFPANLPSVRGVHTSMSIVSSAQDVRIVLTPPATRAVVADKLEAELKRLTEVRAVSFVGRPQLGPLVQMAAWALANLSPAEFAEFQSLFQPATCAARLQETRGQLGGAVEGRELMMLRVDPVRILPWLQQHAPNALPLPDLSQESSEPKFVMAQVRARQPLRTFDECQHFVGLVRQAVDAAVVNPDDRTAIYITGQPAFVAENSGQMKFDTTVMVVLATGLTSLLVLAFYRSWSALWWMSVVLVLAILTSLVAARLFFGELNVISIGFASILIGLGSDYCILVYHFHAVPDSSASWRMVNRGIWTSALTTSLAFGTLYFSRFPGLQQLVVLLGAGLLATAFFSTTLLPQLLQRKTRTAPTWLVTVSEKFAAFEYRQRYRIAGGVVVFLLAAICLWPMARHYQFYDPDFNRLRPAHSEANRGVELLLAATPAGKSFEVIVAAPTWDELRAKAARIERDAMLMPQNDFLDANRAQWQAGKQAALRATLDQAGFEESWGAITLRLLDTLDAWAAGKEDLESARLFLSNVVEHPDGEKVAMLRLPLQGTPRAMGAEVTRREPSSLPASWQLMMDDLQRSVLEDSWRLSLLMLVAVVGVCWWARRSWGQVALNGLALVLTFTGLLALLWLTRESITLHSLLTVPVLVAVAIEYSLYMLLGAAANDGDLTRTFRQLAVPVFLMAATSIIGFGAPVATHQPALQNLGMVLALGTFVAMLAGMVVVPALDAIARTPRVHYSATLYRAFWFEAGAWVGKCFGARGTRVVGRMLAGVYYRTHPQTRAVVKKNLALTQREPVTNAQVRRTLANFGGALADYFLLGTRPRDEVMQMAAETVGLEHILAALEPGKGVILATAHLGLFEFGALWMEQRGQHTVVLTLPEPSPALHQWRAAYRQRWNATTLEIGNGYFSAVEVVRLLKQGRCVAMLIDRPYDVNFVTVDFPGGPAPFSTGPVWLSLLSGSPIVPVFIVRRPEGGYKFQAFPAVRPQWLPAGRDETVRHYTTELGNIFREVICQYPDQWYQFVPLSS